MVAAQNRHHMAVIDERGRIVRPTARYDRLGAIFVADDGAVRWINVAAAAGLVAATVLLLLLYNL